MSVAIAFGDTHAFVFGARTPIGRPFQPTHEAEMIPGLIAAAMRSVHRDRRIIVVPELHGPCGVVDLGLLETTDDILAARLGLGIPPLLNQLDAAIVGCLSARRPLGLATVARSLGWPERDLSGRVTHLRRRGVIAQLRSGCLVRPEGLKPLGHLSVYEAKVNDWKRGFAQAATYATWADDATLALQRLPRDPSRALAMATDLRLGLIADGHWERRAEVQRLPRKTRMWASEHLVAALL